jgi:hypothetical protein
LIEAGHERDEMTLRAAPGLNRITPITAHQEIGAIIQIEPTLVAAAPMALQATGLEDGLDVLGEIDGPRSGGGQAGDLIGGQREQRRRDEGEGE